MNSQFAFRHALQWRNSALEGIRIDGRKYPKVNTMTYIKSLRRSSFCRCDAGGGLLVLPCTCPRSGEELRYTLALCPAKREPKIPPVTTSTRRGRTQRVSGGGAIRRHGGARAIPEQWMLSFSLTGATGTRQKPVRRSTYVKWASHRNLNI